MFNSKIILVARLLLGIILVTFGLNKFIDFMPALELPQAATDFFGAIIGTGYLFQVIAIVEIFTGITLLINRYVPLGLVLMAPITVNIILFHGFLDPSPNIGAGLLVLILQLYLMFANIESFRPLLEASPSKK